jgi:hypothetical protein
VKGAEVIVEDYFKCANCEHSFEEHRNGKCTLCDCVKWELDSVHTEGGDL